MCVGVSICRVFPVAFYSLNSSRAVEMLHASQLYTLFLLVLVEKLLDSNNTILVFLYYYIYKHIYCIINPSPFLRILHM